MCVLILFIYCFAVTYDFRLDYLRKKRYVFQPAGGYKTQPTKLYNAFEKKSGRFRIIHND